MTWICFYDEGLAGCTRTKPLPGRLVALEGTDGVGRSTQIALLREWLKSRSEMEQVLADMKPISPQKAEEELILAETAEKDKRREREDNARQRAKGN